MPRQETDQHALFETYLCEVGAIRAYIRNIRELARVLPSAERDIALSIDKNAALIERKANEAIKTHSELAEAVGYKYLRIPAADSE